MRGHCMAESAGSCARERARAAARVQLVEPMWQAKLGVCASWAHGVATTSTCLSGLPPCAPKCEGTARAGRSPVRKDLSRGPVREPRGSRSPPCGRPRTPRPPPRPVSPHRGAPYLQSRTCAARPLGERDHGGLESAWKRGRGATGPASVRNGPFSAPVGAALERPTPLWGNGEGEHGPARASSDRRWASVATGGRG